MYWLIIIIIKICIEIIKAKGIEWIFAWSINSI